MSLSILQRGVFQFCTFAECREKGRLCQTMIKAKQQRSQENRIIRKFIMVEKYSEGFRTRLYKEDVLDIVWTHVLVDSDGRLIFVFPEREAATKKDRLRSINHKQLKMWREIINQAKSSKKTENLEPK